MIRGLRELLVDAWDRVRDDPLTYSLRRYLRRLPAIDAAATELRACDDDGLRAAFARDVAAGEDRAYAAVREAARRELDLWLHPNQLIAGMALADGKLVEMPTGEGKTLAAVAPAAVAAQRGQGVHVMTFNDYLASRDAAWMGPVYARLGLRVASITEATPTAERREAYRADVTYVTCREAGFDVLRDERARQPDQRVHRALGLCIVDEADSLLIDEARIPLVLAGPRDLLGVDAAELAEIAGSLVEGRHYECDEGRHNVHLTDVGLALVERALARGALHTEDNAALLGGINEALHARALLTRDVDYVVRDGQVELVDEFTGRVADRRRLPYGLHAAVEAKEGLTPNPVGKILGSLTVPHLLALYPTVAGMTATALPAADELEELYELKVVVVPPHRPSQRVDHPDQVYTHAEAKRAALVGEIEAAHRRGQPVLVGTQSVRESEALSAALRERGVAHQLLNARNDAEEAGIIARAGERGAVTISTNMAGRGTDIRLGGPDEADREAVTALGGLYVLGSCRHESRRIDDQLRGRAGRQGDPGATRFLVSLDDDLMRRYRLAPTLPYPPDRQPAPIDDPRILRKVAHLLRVVEGEHFAIRKTNRKYAELVERQRQHLVERRREILEGTAPSLLAAESPERWEALVAELGAGHLADVERAIRLACIDRCWSDYLAHVSHLREGIALRSMSGFDPLVEFHKEIGPAFVRLGDRIDALAVATFESHAITAEGIDLSAAGLGAPGATWTYMVTDQPLGVGFARVAGAVARLMGRDKS